MEFWGQKAQLGIRKVSLSKAQHSRHCSLVCIPHIHCMQISCVQKSNVSGLIRAAPAIVQQFHPETNAHADSPMAAKL